MLRLVGVDPRAEFDEASSSEDLKLLIAQSAHGGKIDAGEAGMLSGVFHLHEQQARQVMTPIPAVVTVDISEDVETALKRMVDSGHTRLVVTEEGNTDRIRGIVHANSLVRLLMTEGPDASIETAVKDALIVPETKPLDDLLADLQRERASMAVVVDEYGRTAGIVTIEDIIEEVVGEIADETDPAVAGIRRLANGDWWVRGHVPITDLQDYGLDLPVDSEAYNSVGGYVFGELGRLPKRGRHGRNANGYSMRVESVRENRIEAVRIRDHRTARSARTAVRARWRRPRPPRADSSRSPARRTAPPELARAGVRPPLGLASLRMWCVKLSDTERDALRALVRAQSVTGSREELPPDLEGALDSLELARWDDLPEATLPWDRVSDLAGRQGIGEADVVWDLAAGMVSPRERSRGTEPQCAGSVVGVEALAGLPAELPLGDQLAHARGHLGADRLADRRGHVEAHEVQQPQRPHRVARRRASCRCPRPSRPGRRPRSAARRRRGRGRAAGSPRSRPCRAPPPPSSRTARTGRGRPCGWCRWPRPGSRAPRAASSPRG